MDRGTFFHDVYRIQQKLGKTFRELEPYALFPVDQYFNGTSRLDEAPAAEFPVETDMPHKAKILKFPVKRAA